MKGNNRMWLRIILFYVTLISQFSKRTMKLCKKKRDLRGSVIIIGDLESASEEIAEEFAKSIEQSAAAL